MSPFFDVPIAEAIWQTKYRYTLNNKPLDSTIDDTWRRVAAAATDDTDTQQSFYAILRDFKFLPGGRILAGAGTQHDVTLFNCFVMHIKNDSLASIFSALKEGALTLQEGGGVGYDFSGIRPHGDSAKKTGVIASGPVSFMKIWNTTCGILLSTGARRGAMMGVLRCDHPDILTFIHAKRDALELRHFNVSVLVTDAFMQAVKADADWPLVFKSKVYQVIKARELWTQITLNAYDYAEPGVLFIDTINRQNNLHYCERIHATNPCGEIPLPKYGACNLGSINLTKFVSAPFTSQAKFDFSAFENCIETATLFLDHIIDASRYPLAAQASQALGTRRMGLGFTGLADTLMMLNIRYGESQAVAWTKKISQILCHVTWHTSAMLAKTKGSFPFYSQKEYLQGAFVQQLPRELFNAVERYGMRNSHHNTIAPAGTISLLAGNISSGIEPIFAAQYQRFVLTSENERQAFEVQDAAVRLWQQGGQSGLPPQFVASGDLSPDEHLNMQCAAQPYIDNAISKTINLPADFPFAQLGDVYAKAYQKGLKGCTIYRPNDITGSVLQITSPEEVVEPCQVCQ